MQLTKEEGKEAVAQEESAQHTITEHSDTLSSQGTQHSILIERMLPDPQKDIPCKGGIITQY